MHRRPGAGIVQHSAAMSRDACEAASAAHETETRVATFAVGDGTEAVRAGRHFVETTLCDNGLRPLADDAGLIAGELLANAQQHGIPPVVLTVQTAGTTARIEVSDASPRAPVRVADSTTNMTGRGLGIVAALASRWGVVRHDEGKAIWVELTVIDTPVDDGDADVDAVLAAWVEDEQIDAADDRYTVVLGDVPTELLIQAKAHIDNVVREFSLAASGATSEATTIPDDLARLIETVVHDFSDARETIKRQAVAAMRRGEPRARLILRLPLSAADAGERYLSALDEADEYARAARLLTLETPPDHRLFRHWYVQAVIDELRAVVAGVPPKPSPVFDDVLVTEIRRLSAAQRISDRSARLQRVTAALARARTPEDVATVVLTEGVDALDASGGGLLVPAGDGEHIGVPGVVGYGAELLDALREEPMDAPLPAATAMRTGNPVWLESPDERDAQFPALRGLEASTVAMCAVPLIVADANIGALRFSFSRRKLFDEDERNFVLALAAQTAQTLQRTERYESERQSALRLQRALLPQEIATLPGWDVATHYSPAGEQEAGGDFYDVITLTDGRFACVVGDVMGRGVDAAAAMASLRSTIAAFATDDPDPASVFSRVDTFFRLRDVQQLVTALYMLVESDHSTVHVVNAGHPPPVLMRDGQCELVTGFTGTPFGVLDEPRAFVTLTLQPGDALIAFTDGLVERRREDIDTGIRRVVDAVCDVPAASSADALLKRALAASTEAGSNDDDVTVLVLKRVEQ
jgi:serine phosphatase RsbU (regulator of sigma subunit)